MIVLKKNTMMYKIFSLLLLATTLCSVAFAQNPTTKSKLFDKLTPEQRARDSMYFLKSKDDHPEYFLNKRLPQRLLDGNYFVQGYSAFAIKITDNHIIDSVYHNFHRGSMGSGVPPYNSIQVTDEKISVDLFNPFLLGGYGHSDSTYIKTVDESKMKDGFVDNKPFSEKGSVGLMNNTYSYLLDTIGLPSFKGDSVELRISINGKLLFDWTKLSQFSKKVFSLGNRFGPVHEIYSWMLEYSYGYHICEQNIKINDQLLIEIKDDKTGWMLDRFNFTRVAATPTVASISATDDKNKPLPTNTLNGTSIEKKTLR